MVAGKAEEQDREEIRISKAAVAVASEAVARIRARDSCQNRER